MSASAAFALSLATDTLVLGMAARMYVVPRLASMDPAAIVVPILLLHASRHSMFLLAWPDGAGDLALAALALASLGAFKLGSRLARPLLWTFNSCGAAGLLVGVGRFVASGATLDGSRAYWVPACWVPALLATHYVLFMVLARPQGGLLGQRPI